MRVWWGVLCVPTRLWYFQKQWPWQRVWRVLLFWLMWKRFIFSVFLSCDLWCVCDDFAFFGGLLLWRHRRWHMIRDKLIPGKKLGREGVIRPRSSLFVFCLCFLCFLPIMVLSKKGLCDGAPCKQRPQRLTATNSSPCCLGPNYWVKALLKDCDL
jgi:hypothetical protein